MTNSAILNHFETLPGVFLITNLEAKILYANRSVQEETGFSASEVIGKNPAALWGKQMPTAYYRKLWQTLALGGIPFISPVKNKKKNGSIYNTTLRLAPIIGEDERVKYLIALSTPKQIDEEMMHLFTHQRRVSGNTILMHIVHWLGASRKELMDNQKEGDIEALLSSDFIEPMQERYSDRAEDQLFVEQAKNNPKEFSVLFSKYHDKIFRYLIHRTSSGAVASDITQETFLKAFKYLAAYESSNSSYGTYLLRIAHNELVNNYRKQRGKQYQSLGAEEIPYEEQAFTEVEYRQVARKLLTLLSEEERLIVEMKYLEDMRVKEIADIIGKTENAVKLHLSRARKKILERAGAFFT